MCTYLYQEFADICNHWASTHKLHIGGIDQWTNDEIRSSLLDRFLQTKYETWLSPSVKKNRVCMRSNARLRLPILLYLEIVIFICIILFYLNQEFSNLSKTKSKLLSLKFWKYVFQDSNEAIETATLKKTHFERIVAEELIQFKTERFFYHWLKVKH